MRIAVLSANLGSYDVPREWPEQQTSHEVTYVRLHDGNFPPRPLAMTSRLQCGIPKWFGVDFVPKETDVIIWIDASCVPTPFAVEWFLEKLDCPLHPRQSGADIAVFAHPDRRTVRDEFEFMTRKLAEGNRYLTSRYKGEWLDEMYRRIGEASASKLMLFASTAFAYRLSVHDGEAEIFNDRVTKALADVFLWKSRYLLHDQLAFPWSLYRHGVRKNVIHENYLKCPALEYVRNKR